MGAEETEIFGQGITDILNDPSLPHSQRANDDADEIAAYIARDNMDAALGFYDAFLQARERLTVIPGIGPVYGVGDPEWADVRFWPITHYSNYLIFYRPIDGGVEILRILHGARNISRL